MENTNKNMVEEIQVAAEEIVENGSLDAKVVAGVVLGGAAIVAGGVALYKKVLKPKVEAYKAKKNGITIEQGIEPEIEAENVEVK